MILNSNNKLKIIFNKTRNLLKIDGNRYTSKLLRNIHFWILICLILLLVYIYQYWPWRIWEFEYGISHWFKWLSSLDYLALFELRYHFIGSLFLIPIIYSAIIFNWKGALITSAFSVVYSMLAIGLWVPVDYIIVNVTILLMPSAVVTIIAIEMQLRRKEMELFNERENRRKLYLAKVMEAQEKERKRLAQEIHDDTIQVLSAIASHAESLEVNTDNNINEMKNKATWIKEMIRQVIGELRKISLDLRPGILDNLGLSSALSWLTTQNNEACDTHTQLMINGIEHKLDPSVEVVIFRIIQEALNNVKRHSNAKQAMINLNFSNASVLITIFDDGQGFTLPVNVASFATEGKLGLIGIKERVESLRGTLKIHSMPLEGFKLLIEIPYS